ncbi:MAG: hypothetical protein OEY24_03335 [Candidatus Bathyarchaeota archaeon]|nr:hypothetical protein [Candidatus Bathyarchaeota archaeon]MDH5494718.1 hypothetical protein [Candidatus Bathyarchaeota archaeon]
MPISKKDFKNGKFHSKVEEEIISFLNERKERAYTSQEIMGGIHYHTEFSTPEITKMSTFAIADFITLLYDLVKKRKVEMKIVRGRMYFTTRGNGVAKCPKCGLEITEPKKMWKMAGRPDKKGTRLQMHIGLFECPKHGTFRVVLDKQKISTRVQTNRQTRQKKKRVGRKKSTKKKKKRKPKSDAWSLL